MPYLRRRLGRKKVLRRRVYRKRPTAGRNYVRLRNRTGFIKVVRKTGEIFVQNSAVAGAVQITDSTGTCLQMSTAGVSTGFANTFDLPFAMKFSLSQILNSSDITNICDKYKIKKTVIRIYFNSNQNSIQSTNSLPQVTYMTDQDDASIPTSAQVREKMGAKIKYFNSRNYVTLVCYPRPVTEVFNTGVTSAYSPGRQLWIDCNNNNVEHYGLKGVLQNVNLAASPSFAVGFKFDVTHTIYGKDIQ